MVERFNIAGYARISVDDEVDKKKNQNISIEHQKLIIEDYVKTNFPGSTLTFFEDRDRSGYTFEQREGYQEMRRGLMSGKFDILIIKDFSRFSRRNSRGLVELEDLRDKGVRVISIGDFIDFSNDEDWLKIQFQFLVNEMPVTDTSKKVRNVIKRRQEDGKWICAVPYGYLIVNPKEGIFKVEPNEAAVVKKVFELYIEGWGYQKIANYLTDQHIPTPRMNERTRKEAEQKEYHHKVRPEWSIVTVQGIIENDFYIGTLRQGKYTRKKINGLDIKRDVEDHLVFENHHEAIIDYRTFAIARQLKQKRTKSNYRGVKKYDNVYSGLMECGDCGSPMFPMSRSQLKDAYRCGKYHQRGLKGCTSHHIKVETLDALVKGYLQNVRDTSSEMIARLQRSIAEEDNNLETSREAVDILEAQLEDARAEKKMLARQHARELMRFPDKEDSVNETYDSLIAECEARIEGLENQITMIADRQNTVIRVNRIAGLAINIFDEILNKDKLDKNDLELLIDRIYIYEDHIHIKLKADIQCILESGTLTEEQAANFNCGIIDSLKTEIVEVGIHRPDKVYDVSIISNGDPLEIYTDREGEVIFKKYSPIGELSAFATQYAEAMWKTCGLAVIICDRDAVIACAGVPKKEYLEKNISEELEKVMSGRTLYVADEDDVSATHDGGSYYVGCAMPIINEGDVIGCVAALHTGGGACGEVEQKLISTASSFLGKQMES